MINLTTRRLEPLLVIAGLAVIVAVMMWCGVGP